MAKITIEFDFDDLIYLGEDEEEVKADSKEAEMASNIKRSLQWRGKRPGTKIFKNDQIITDVVMRGNQLVFKYRMAHDLSNTEHEFRVPADNLPFIQEAVDAGLIEVGKPLWVTVESDKKKRNQWIRIEER